MALEATHMRFALDVKGYYTVQDIAKYIQGTIYPDSRYVSGINRKLTHRDTVLKPEFASNDFNIGWQVHQSCDKIQRKILHNKLPELNKLPVGQEDWWIAITAAKIIADMKDVQSFDIQSTLQHLKSTFCPNGEDVSAIQRNNQIILALYKNRNAPSIDDYIVMWNELGISEELGNKVRKKVEQFVDDGLSDTIWSCYNEMVDSFDKARLESL